MAMDAMQPPPPPKRQKQPPFPPEGDLPQRRLCFKRKLQLDVEERFREMVIAAVQEVKTRETTTPLGMVMILGRVVGTGTRTDVILPTATEVLLDERGQHNFVPDLSPELFQNLGRRMQRRLAEHKAQPVQERRWSNVSLEQRQVRSAWYKTAATFYCPVSRWHYQLRFRQEHPEGPEGYALPERKETNLVFQKVDGPDDPMWTFSLVQEGGKAWVELRMNEVFLVNHQERMSSSKPHSFNRLCRDYRRNAQAIQHELDLMDPLQGDVSQKLFYPSMFDSAARVQDFYHKRALQQSQGGEEMTAKIRRFNNCVKTMMLERFMDGMKGELRILDLACGRGQDILKYSTEHRLCTVRSVVGIDFAAEAVEEAKRRYSTLCHKAQRAGRHEFIASFRRGDLRHASTFADLAKEGFHEFDVVVCQLALHYLLNSEEAAKQFLQHVVQLLCPGGRFIATVPSCEVLADFYEKASFTGERNCQRMLQHSLFQVRFQGEAWQRLQDEGVQLELDEVFLRQWGLPYLFSLEGAVHGEEYILPWEAFEELAESFGLRVLADASFPDLFNELKTRSRFYNGVFSKDRENAYLDHIFKMAATGIEEVLQSLMDTLGLCAEKIKEGSLGQVMEDLELSFSLEEFWMKLGMTFRAVSKEATKLTISFSKPPVPSVDELQCLLTGFETSVVAMLTIFRSLPISQGKYLYKKLQESVLTVVDDCQILAASFIKEGCSSVASAKTKSTGTLWEHCDGFQHLPADDKHAVLQVFHSSSELIKDALTELNEAQKCNGCQENDCDEDDNAINKDGWSSEDKLLVPPCIGLVKACRSCLKKISSAIQTSGQVTSVENIQQLDSMADEIQRTSSSVDDVVMSLYSPMNHHNVSESATKLSDQLKEILNKARDSHFTLDSDSSWLDFLTKAIDHNMNKVTSVLHELEETNT